MLLALSLLSQTGSWLPRKRPSGLITLGRRTMAEVLSEVLFLKGCDTPEGMSAALERLVRLFAAGWACI